MATKIADLKNFDFSSLPKDENAALAQFRASLGRDPTSAEISAYRKAFSASGSSSGSVSSSAVENPAKITTNLDMSLEPVKPYEPMELPEEGARTSFDSTSADAAAGALESMISELRDKNKAWMEGRISGDTADQLRSQSALSARAGGIGTTSQAARSLQARDFGLTSMAIQEKGMATEGALAQLQQSAAALRENRYQFLSNLTEQQHQFSEQLITTRAAAGEQSRQFGAGLADQLTRTQLAHKELMLKQEAFNADMNMQLVQLISSVTMAQTGQQLTAAQSNIDDSGITSTFNNLQAQLQRLISSSNKTTK